MKLRIVLEHGPKPIRSVRAPAVTLLRLLSHAERCERVRQQARAALARYKAKHG